MKFYLQCFIHCWDFFKQLELDGDTGLASVQLPGHPVSFKALLAVLRLSCGAKRGNKEAVAELCFSGWQLEDQKGCPRASLMALEACFKLN